MDGKSLWVLLSAIIGWYVVHRLAVARERAKFRKDAIAKEAMELAAAANALLEKAIDYHCNDRDEIVERALNNGLARLTLRIEHLPTTRDKLENSAALSAAIIFKQSITGIHFEDEHSFKLSPGDQAIAEMQLSAFQLETQLLLIRSATMLS